MSIVRRIADAVDGQKEPETGRPKSWWRWPILILLVLLALAAVVWVWRIAAKDRRELARLRHEAEKARVEADNAKIDAAIADNDIEVAERKRRVEASQKRVLELEIAWREVDERHQADLAAIDRITLRALPRGE